ncbi:hypothetical protein SPSIL_051630 [Sporomusa silvacetica DSM 10669]|uniref:DUF2179 domain-containing protein n=1 Tax=Sporomusa silvacetica DSM 10669 TaxID=1123289 RepID=A0ABZ3IT97_9FIRM|nr:YitT family protein [Sporomusa silvacetica]OZC19794.1 hypothetical protein SPSIL_19210 [Sporomusa silvacetica DSM 10669]
MLRTIYQYVLVAFGCLLISIAINGFLVPHHLLSAGISGIAIIFYYLFGWPIGLQIFVMNLPLIYAAYRILGTTYTIGTIYGATMMSFAVEATKFLVNYNLIDDPIISAIAGGIITGLGSGCIFRARGSAGGLDIMAAIIKKYYSFNLGIASFGINCVITLIGATMFGLKLAMITLIAMYVSATITDRVVEGFNRKKAIHIVSYNNDEIVQAILEEIGRGVTVLQATGAFTRKEKKVLFVVVRLTQVAKIKQIVQDVDPYAFMTIQDAAEVMGRGFTLPERKLN